MSQGANIRPLYSMWLHWTYQPLEKPHLPFLVLKFYQNTLCYISVLAGNPSGDLRQHTVCTDLVGIFSRTCMSICKNKLSYEIRMRSGRAVHPNKTGRSPCVPFHPILHSMPLREQSFVYSFLVFFSKWIHVRSQRCMYRIGRFLHSFKKHK